MKKPFDVLRYRYIAMGASGLLIAVGIVLFFVLGFNAGIDFASGYSERFQIAPLGFTATYSGPGSAVLSVSDGSLALTLRTPEGIAEAVFPPSQYPSSNDLAAALEERGVEARTYSDCDSRRLVSGFGFPAELSSSPVRVNFASDSMPVSASDVREALSGLGSVNVQSVGGDGNAFQIRMGVDEDESQSSVSAEVEAALDAAFGAENVVVLQSDFVGPKFSSSLFRDSFIGLAIALVLILGYIAIRFRFAYAISSIIALFHDVLAMLSFILIFRLEVSSTTIAAVLTIIGYSINNTIVIFDRVRENMKECRERGMDVDSIIALSVRQSCTRSVMTSLTTLVAIVPLSIFGSGDIQTFALNLTWGIIAGAYSSNFLAPAFLSFFHRVMPIDVEKEKKEEEEYSLV